MVVWLSVLILRFLNLTFFFDRPCFLTLGLGLEPELYLPVFPLKLITDSTFRGLVVGDRGQELIHLYNKRG